MLRVSERKALAYLYVDEDKRLMAAKSVPIQYRLLWGFLAREGMRIGEAAGLRWGDLDLVRGAVNLDHNKSDDPRAWALQPGVRDALQAYKRDIAKDTKPTAAVFLDEYNRPLVDLTSLPGLLRGHLRAIGLEEERPELFERSAVRLPIRVHDLRATFITHSLASGKSETWISDRTGHASSQMIQRYKRAAR